MATSAPISISERFLPSILFYDLSFDLWLFGFEFLEFVFFRLLLLLAVLVMPVSNAAWYEATGQAVIHQGNKELARQKATQEAIRQALLFAGASVRSVQQMTDGLLEDENLEIRASGEVSRIELISEHYYDDFIEVAIRADIFSQEKQCSASDYKKSIGTSKFHFSAIRQSSNGGLSGLAMPLTQRIQSAFDKYSKYSMISAIEPYTFFPRKEELKIQRDRRSAQKLPGKLSAFVPY